MILRITRADVAGPHSLHLAFNNGTEKRVNVEPLLEGPVFEPLKDPTYFSRVALDSVCGTVVWPNGADFAPEALLALPSESEVFSSAQKGS
ncbi:MAG: DUF2442 domain-containing protein [Planctomycetes bacterium]|nr:DUF2442 domain-containing protein [Planctomycetota bacterium]